MERLVRNPKTSSTILTHVYRASANGQVDIGGTMLEGFFNKNTAYFEPKVQMLNMVTTMTPWG